MAKRRKSMKARRAAAWPVSEADLAAALVSQLETEGYEIFQEVMVWPGGPVADIVARRGDFVQIIECKRRLNLVVLAQAHRWRHFADQVAIALPACLPSGGHELDFAERVCRHEGLGWLAVHKECHHSCIPALTNPALRKHELLNALCAEHKTFAKAGTQAGHWTPFKATKERLLAYVAAHPACTLHAAVAAIEHHYSSAGSARASLLRLIRRGVLPELRLDRGPASQWLLLMHKS